MATPQPAFPSPIAGSTSQFQNGFQQSDGDFSSLDFLNLIGLDGSIPQSDNDSPQFIHPPAPQSEAGPSSQSIRSAGSSAASRTSSKAEAEEKPHGRGRTRIRASRRRGGGSSSLQRDKEMDVDQAAPPVEMPYETQGDSSGETHAILNAGMGIYGMHGESFDAGQARFLQQQLEQVHMQSPLMYDPTNGQLPFGSVAQMYLASQGDHPTQPQSPAHFKSNVQGENGNYGKWSGSNGVAGILTPAVSGSMYPQMRSDMMSPVQLEAFARGEGVEGTPDHFNIVPLLSPALSLQAGSAYASPADQTAFPGQSTPSNQYGQHIQTSRSPIEQLQEQQRQFQEQLLVLQQQQRQLQATAAAVVATSVSPHAPSSGPNSVPIRPTSAPEGNPQNPSSANTPSSGFFSPLTSPALEASSRTSLYNNQNHGFSPAHTQQQQHQHHRQPHPRTAMSSPALNPVGSSGGAQQTLSPALQPQNSDNMADPDYLRALVGFLDSQPHNVHAITSTYHSPIISSNQQVGNSSPVGGPSSGTGPHRNTLPAKSRPSPMMKPTNHRSHTRQPSGSGLPGQMSMPSSPLVHKFHPAVPGMGYLPPAAIDQRGVQQHHQAMLKGQSQSSTPSPVDLSQIMPPPPIPMQNGGPKGITPMTPATLMNLAQAGSDALLEPHQAPALAPKRQAASKKATPILPVPATGKTGNGLKIATSTAGKRSLVKRAQGGANRASARTAATAAFVPPEGETRRTSHKAAEQKRRDSLKAGFDELRLLLPPINTEALDPESGEPIPGSSAPRLLPKSSLVPDDNPNRGVSKVALLRFSNEYIVRLHEKVEKRDGYVCKLRDEIRRLRAGGKDEVTGDAGEDLLDMDMLEGEEEDFDGQAEVDGIAEEDGDERQEEDGDEDMDEVDDDEEAEVQVGSRPRRAKSLSERGSWSQRQGAGAKYGRGS